jgi:hypothetical protein
MKKNYTDPELSVRSFNHTSIITASEVTEPKTAQEETATTLKGVVANPDAGFVFSL